MDKWRYSTWYCENHEWKDCYIYKNNLDTRTKEERRLHTPCCENIHDYLVRNDLDSLPEQKKHFMQGIEVNYDT